MEILLCTSCVFLAAFAAIFAANQYLRRRRLLGEVLSSKDEKRSPLQHVARMLGRATSKLSGALFVSTVECRMLKRLLSAGISSKDVARGFLVIEISASVVGAIFALAIFDEHKFFFAILGGVSPCLILELWLLLKIRARRESIERDLPFALDMMTLCVEAGLDLAQAMTRVCYRLKTGPLSCELKEVTYALRTGSSRSQALSKMMRPGSDPALSSLAFLLIQSDRMGSGVGPVLRSTSARMRQARFMRAERRGAVAAQKALVPLIVCIMPATFVVVFGPIAIRLIRGGVEALL